MTFNHSFFEWVKICVPLAEDKGSIPYIQEGIQDTWGICILEEDNDQPPIS